MNIFFKILRNKRIRNIILKYYYELKEYNKHINSSNCDRMNSNIHSLLEEMNKALSMKSNNSCEDDNFQMPENEIEEIISFYRKYIELRKILNNLDEIIDIQKDSEGLFEIQLREKININEVNYSNIFHALMLDIFKNSSIEIENHDNMGYHIHYLERKERTNIILLFNNKKKYDKNLYWDKHNNNTAKTKLDCSTIGQTKKKKIYVACSKYRDKWNNFRALAKNEQIFYIPLENIV